MTMLNKSFYQRGGVTTRAVGRPKSYVKYEDIAAYHRSISRYDLTPEGLPMRVPADIAGDPSEPLVEVSTAILERVHAGLIDNSREWANAA